MHIVERHPHAVFGHKIDSLGEISGSASAVIRSRSSDPDAGPQVWTRVFSIPTEVLIGAEDWEAEALSWMVGSTGPFPTGEIVEDAEFAVIFKKAELRRRVKEKRDEIERLGLLTPLGRVDTDADSQRKLSGASLMALVCLLKDSHPDLAALVGQMLDGTAFGMSWRMADDTRTDPLTEVQIISLGLRVGMHVSACQQIKNDLDDQIEAVALLEDADLINVEEGWPD